MKKLLGILVALFMFANVSFAQKQETFFGVKFGASKQEVINAFKKHGLVIAEEYEGSLLFLAEQKEYIKYLNYDWNEVRVTFSNSEFNTISFFQYFKSEELASKNHDLILSKLTPLYDNITCTMGWCRAFLENFSIYFNYIEMIRDEISYYGTQIFYERTIPQIETVEEIEELVIQTIQDELPPPPDMDKYLDEDGNILPQYLDEDGNFIPQIEIEEEEEEEEEETIFTVVEESAMFPGGQEELMKYISENLRYPQQAREEGTQGLVYVTFVVEKDGSLTDIRILRDLGNGCGEEAVRIVKTMPKWIPAKQRGKEVRMQYNLPVKFTLAE